MSTRNLANMTARPALSTKRRAVQEKLLSRQQPKSSSSSGRQQTLSLAGGTKKGGRALSFDEPGSHISVAATSHIRQLRRSSAKEPMTFRTTRPASGSWQEASYYTALPLRHIHSLRYSSLMYVTYARCSHLTLSGR